MSSPLKLTGLIASTTKPTPPFAGSTSGTSLSESLRDAMQSLVTKPLEWFSTSWNKEQLQQIQRIADRLLVASRTGRAISAQGGILGKVPQRDGLFTLSTELNTFQNVIRDYLENDDQLRHFTKGFRTRQEAKAVLMSCCDKLKATSDQMFNISRIFKEQITTETAPLMQLFKTVFLLPQECSTIIAEYLST